MNLPQTQDCDIAIVGAGPAGLCFALALADTPLRIVLIERQPESALAEPAFDGREIALTHFSVAELRRLGVWERIPAEDVSALRDARVLNGDSSYSMHLGPDRGGEDALGSLVSNHLIRRAAYEAVKAQPQVVLRTQLQVGGIRCDNRAAELQLADGSRLTARLVVAADSRFSETRRAMGIGAEMKDFGKTMLVCRMAHERPHQHTAWECFHYGGTVALLPMNGARSSVVITLPHHQAQRLLRLDDADFAREVERRIGQRLGTMRLVSDRHLYPLVAVYPHRFSATRYAVVGDAAVGMHPVTAHGFNLGLRGTHTLAAEIRTALARRADIGAGEGLQRYEREHRRATRPLYLATQAIVGLYTDDRLPARLVRSLALRAGNHLAPFKSAVARLLADREDRLVRKR